MPMPPRWALGYQQCRYSYYPDARVREIADTFRAKQIPCDVIWLDIDYMDGFRVFTFDPNHFPDPKATNDYLHSLGFKSVWMIDPGVKNDPGYFVYDSGTREDVWVMDASGKPFVGPVWPGDCVFPDFTMPRTAQWWAGLYQDFLACGIDGIWNDMNEPAVFKGEWTMPSDCCHRGGGDLPPGPHIQYQCVWDADGQGHETGDPNGTASKTSLCAVPGQLSRRPSLCGDLDGRQRSHLAASEVVDPDVPESESFGPAVQRA
jgi:alpha-glucosidase